MTVAETTTSGAEDTPPPTIAEPDVDVVEGEQTEEEPVGLSDADYQRELDAHAEEIGRAIERIERARTHTILMRRASQAARVARRVADRFAELLPPKAAQDAHGLLSQASSELARAFERMTKTIRSQNLCAAPSVLARVSQFEAAASIQEARVALRASGFELPALLPRHTPTQDRRLATGTFVLSGERPGSGRWRIDNGRAVDALAAITRADRPGRAVISVYVQARSEYTITGIPDGAYRLFFTFGRDWDDEHRRFTRMCGFAAFDEPFLFDTTPTFLPGWEVSLHPVSGGTASTSDVAPDAFPSL